jgi:hypothetical protein
MDLKVEDSKTREETAKLKNCQKEPVGIGGWPPIYTWIKYIYMK